MSDILEKFGKLSVLYKVLMLIVGLTLIGYVYWQYFYKSPAKELGESVEAVEKLQADLRHHRLLARNLPKIREEVKILDAELIEALAELPNKQETSRLLESISDLATDAGLEVKVFAEQGESYREFYGSKSVNLQVKGAFHQIASFFDEVGQMSRIVNIDRVNLKNPTITKEGIYLDAQCFATTFWYLSDTEKKVESDQNKGKKRKR